MRLNPKSNRGIAKPGPALQKTQAAGCRREIHSAKLDCNDQTHNCERLLCGQLELPKTEAHVKQHPSSKAARRGISQMVAHPPVSAPDLEIMQSDLAGVHTSPSDDKKGRRKC